MEPVWAEYDLRSETTLKDVLLLRRVSTAKPARLALSGVRRRRGGRSAVLRRGFRKGEALFGGWISWQLKGGGSFGGNQRRGVAAGTTSRRCRLHGLICKLLRLFTV